MRRPSTLRHESYSVQGCSIAGKKHDSSQNVCWFLKKLHVGLSDDAECSFTAYKQIDPIHAGRQLVTGCVFGCVRRGMWGTSKVKFVAALHVEDAAVYQNNSQTDNVAARAAVAKTARSASVGGDGAADAGCTLGRIGRVELIRALGGRLQGFERNARACDRPAFVNFQAAECFERYSQPPCATVRR